MDFNFSIADVLPLDGEGFCLANNELLRKILNRQRRSSYSGGAAGAWYS
jgi:hypothetical protein